MSRTNIQRRPRALILFAALALLVVSLLLVACGSATGSTNAHGSNISTNGTTQQTTSGTPGSNIQDINQQIQTAVSSVDGAQNDVNGADSSSNNDNSQQP